MSGTTGSFHYLMVSIGITMSAVILIGDKFDDDKYQLYLSFGFPIVTCALRIILFYNVYPLETAKYYVLTGQQEKAGEVIAKTCKYEYINQQLQQIYSDTMNEEGDVIRSKHLFGFLREQLLVGIAIVFFN